MNEIVIQNGTMLDRIDANIETTKINYQKGNKQLVSVNILKDNMIIGDLLKTFYEFAFKILCFLLIFFGFWGK